jgi:hypothetical protein
MPRAPPRTAWRPRCATAFVVPGTSVPSVIERAGAYDLVFKAVDPFAASGSGLRAIRLRYCLDTADLANEALVLQVQAATTSATPTDTACPSSAWDVGKTRRVAENIVSQIGGQARPVFGYSYSPADSASLPEIQAIGRTWWSTSHRRTFDRAAALDRGVAAQRETAHPSPP